MENKEKLEIIKHAASEASKLVYDLKCILYDAQDETNYKFSYTIIQEIEDGYMSGLRADLEDICNGDKDKEILEELEHDN